MINFNESGLGFQLFQTNLKKTVSMKKGLDFDGKGPGLGLDLLKKGLN